MKYLLWSLALFLFFLGVLMSVKTLDAYSTQYVACANHHTSVVDNKVLSVAARQALVEQITTNGTSVTVNAKSCPPLLDVHQAKLKARLKQGSPG